MEHFLPQRPYKVLKKRKHVLRQGDTIYKIASELFGEESSYFWTIIADLNPLKRVEDWRVGDTVYLPVEIVDKRD